MFSEIIQQFDQYRKELLETKGRITAQDAELGKKLDQLNWLINRAKFLNDTIISAPTTYDFDRMEELEIITEAFYHFAWRVKEIIDHHPKLEIKKTKVGRVRNNLIQHPEKEGNKQKSYPSFEVGDHNGPKIKSYKGPDDSYQDEGLFINAEDFIQKLSKLIGKI